MKGILWRMRIAIKLKAWSGDREVNPGWSRWCIEDLEWETPAVCTIRRGELKWSGLSGQVTQGLKVAGGATEAVPGVCVRRC